MKGTLHVLVKCAAILILFSACTESQKSEPEKPLKVLKSINGTTEKKVENLVIKVITPQGEVVFGKPQDSPRDCIEAVRSYHVPVFKLDGKASVGDQAIIVRYFEDQLLENGVVRRVVTKTVVRSVRNKEIEKYFSNHPTVGENQPGTK